jgi:hypothetical protein
MQGREALIGSKHHACRASAVERAVLSLMSVDWNRHIPGPCSFGSFVGELLSSDSHQC